MIKDIPMYDSVMIERPASEGDQIKNAIRYLFETSRQGALYNETYPLEVRIKNVNGRDAAILCLYRHPEKHGAIVMWYK